MARIIEAAAAVLAEQPRASLQDIADAARVNRVTLYRHFANRDELVIAIAQAAWAEWEELAADIPATGPALPAFAAFFDRAIAIGERYRIIVGHDSEPEARDAEATALAALARVLERAVAQGEIDPWIDPVFGLAMAGSLVATAVIMIGRGAPRPAVVEQSSLAWLKTMSATEAP